MSLEKNKAIVRRWIEEVNKQNLAILDELVAPDFFHPTWQLRGPKGMKQFYAMFLKGFPDCHETIEDIIAEGDKVWHRFKTTGTHIGEFEFGPIRLAPSTISHSPASLIFTSSIIQSPPYSLQFIKTEYMHELFLILVIRKQINDEISKFA